MGNLDRTSGLLFERFRALAFEDVHVMTVSTILFGDQRIHLAAVAGTNFAKLYANGMLISTNEVAAGWKHNPLPLTRNFLGRDVKQTITNTSRNPDLNGQVAEVRFWAGERTPDQIKGNVLTRLSGREPGLLALWNFADGTANDATTNGHHGVLRGNAKVVLAPLPTSAQTIMPSIVYGKVTDETGQPLRHVRLRLEQEGRELMRVFTVSDSNLYSFAMNSPDKPFDIEARSNYGEGDLVAWKLGIKPRPGEPREINLVLRNKVIITGNVLSLNTNQPLNGIVVEAIPARTDGSASAQTERGLQSVSVETPPQRTEVRAPPVLTVVTDNGVFTFRNLKPGAYQVRCHVPGGFVESTNVVVVEDSENASAPPPPSLTFQLTPFKKGSWRSYDSSHGLLQNDVREMAFDSEGMLWLANRGGVSRYDGREFLNLTKEEGLPGNQVTVVDPDTNGVMWFASHDAGVSRYDPVAKSWQCFTTTNGLLRNVVLTIHREPGGAMWFGGEDGAVRYDPAAERNGGKAWSYITTTNGSPSSTVLTILREPSGATWFGGWGQQASLVRMEGTNLVHFGPGEGLAGDELRAIHRDGDGTLWFFLGTGLARYDPSAAGAGNNPFTVVLKANRWNQRPRSIHRDTEGMMWIGTGEGVWRYDDKSFLFFNKADGLLCESVESIQNLSGTDKLSEKDFR